MRVIRTMPDEGWVAVANAAARDYGLSWRARGVLVELLSYPDGWETTIDKLVAQGRKHGKVTEGRAAMRKAMKELADAGYVTYERRQDEHGHWTTDTVVSDQPNPNGSDRRTKNRTVGVPVQRSPGTSVDGTSGDRHVTKNTDTNTVTKTDLQDEDQHSSSLTSFATAADAAASDSTPEAHLNQIYERINRMPADKLRNGLLDLEKRRPKIYRQCRNKAINQIKKDAPDDLKKAAAAEIIDQLSYKYAALHYQPDWPVWFTRPLQQRSPS